MRATGQPDVPSTPYNARSKPLLRTNDVHLHAATRRGGAAAKIRHAPCSIVPREFYARLPVTDHRYAPGVTKTKGIQHRTQSRVFNRSLKIQMRATSQNSFHSVFHRVYRIFTVFSFHLISLIVRCNRETDEIANGLVSVTRDCSRK